MKKKSSITALILLISWWTLQISPALAQDLEPRRWTPLPMGTNVIGIGYGRTTGDVIFDPVLEVENAKVEIDSLVVSYVRAFSLAGKLARFDAFLPSHNARWEGLLSGEPATVQRKGIADPVFRVSLNLMGAPVAGPAELKKYMSSRSVNTVIGAAVSVQVPLGEYHEDKLLNLGQNRFTIRPQIGVVYSSGPWSYELTGSVFFFTDNNDFFNGKTREQEPLYTLQTHVVRRLKPGMWASLSAGYGRGGRSTINGVRKDDKKSNLLSAFSVGFPVTRKQGVKIAYVHGKTRTDTGADTESLVLGWSLLF